MNDQRPTNAILAGIGAEDDSAVSTADRIVSCLERAGYRIVPRTQHEALMAAALWLLKLRSLGYVSAGHGRAIADEALSIVRAAGIEIQADTARDERMCAIGLRAAGIHEGEGK
jgi:hypothetical protein